MGIDQTTHRPSEKNDTFSSDYDSISEDGMKRAQDVRFKTLSEKRSDHKAGINGNLTVRDPGKDPRENGTGPDFNVNVSRKENRIHTQVRNPRPDPVDAHGNCRMGCSPYVLYGSSSPPSSPSGRCKSPFVPSFKDVTKIFSFPSFLWSKVDAFIGRLNKWTKNADKFAEHCCAHVKIGGNVSETVMGKVSLGTKIVAEGGVDNLFKISFSVGPKEKLLKTSSCYLSTSSGPIAGLLFISTEKIAFCSERPVSFTSTPSRKNSSSYYRVVIPLIRADSVNQYENMDKPAEKYIQIQTVDNHEFWFMGFVNYKKALKHLQRVVKNYP